MKAEKNKVYFETYSVRFNEQDKLINGRVKCGIDFDTMTEALIYVQLEELVTQ